MGEYYHKDRHGKSNTTVLLCLTYSTYIYDCMQHNRDGLLKSGGILIDDLEYAELKPVHTV